MSKEYKHLIPFAGKLLARWRDNHWEDVRRTIRKLKNVEIAYVTALIIDGMTECEREAFTDFLDPNRRDP